MIPEIPGYKLDDVLGRGSFAVVWRGTQLETGQAVAVKVLDGAVTDLDYLAAEVERLTRITGHPHVVTLLDAGLSHDPPYLVTPLLKTSLSRFGGDAHHRQPVEQVEAWLGQMTAALETMHRKGILHCDIKPGNVLLHEDGDVRIVDFGQSRTLGEDEGLSLGTFWYMPPEQVMLPPQADAPPVPDVGWDVYALGATVYELLTGCRARCTPESLASCNHIKESAGRLEAYRQALLQTPLTPIRSLNPKVGDDLAHIVEHCLELEPARRYHSMTELREDLARSKSRLPLLAHPATFGYVLKRFVARNSIAVVALMLLFGLQIGQTAWQMERARAAAEAQLLAHGEQADLALRSAQQNRLRWLSVTAGFEAANPLLHRLLVAVDADTLQDALRDLQQEVSPEDQSQLLLILTDHTGRVRVRTDAQHAPPLDLSAMPPVQAALQGEAGEGTWWDGDSLYSVAAAPVMKGAYPDCAFLACWRWTTATLAETARQIGCEITVRRGERILVTSQPEAGAVAAALPSDNVARLVISAHGVSYAAYSAPLDGSTVVTYMTPSAPLLSPLSQLRNTYVLQSLIALSLASLVMGLVLWRSEVRHRRPASFGLPTDANTLATEKTSKRTIKVDP